MSEDLDLFYSQQDMIDLFDYNQAWYTDLCNLAIDCFEAETTE